MNDTTLLKLQLILDQLETRFKINDDLAKEPVGKSEYSQGAVFGIELANDGYERPLKKLRSLIEEIGKGNLYLIDDVRLDGGEDHATA
jgi:hypothetical protein